MNILKIGCNVTVIFNDGRLLALPECTDEMFADLSNNEYSYNEVLKMISPDFIDTMELKKFISESSSWLKLRGSSVIMPSVSEISIPEDFVEKFVEAERDGNEDLIETYTNFWTLVSLNPDSRVRDNIFWFIRKWDMKISKSGLIVAYRNADIKRQGSKFDVDLIKCVMENRERIKHVTKKSPKNYKVIKGIYNACGEGERFEDNIEYIVIRNDINNGIVEEVGNLEDLYQQIIAADKEEVTTFTDHHSHTFTIKIGEPVRMPRENVDSVQEHSCSSGLHVAGREWLRKNYFGDVGLKVLVNPSAICAVPVEDSYGKMRTCEYLPIGTIEFDEEGNVVDNITTEGYEDEYFNKISYKGEVNNRDANNYTLSLPSCLEVDKETAWENLRRIAKEAHQRNANK